MTPASTGPDDLRKLAFIDALRGYAILLVVMVHSSLQVPPDGHVLQLLMAGGARGVQLFYIASALTLCMSWRFRSAHEQGPLRNFFIRRFFRIAPMFYIAIAFYVFLYGLSPRYWAPNGLEWWYVALTALFLHGFHPETITSVVPGGWSIAVEMNFYLVLPFLLGRVHTLRAALVLFAASLTLYAASVAVFQSVYGPRFPESQQYLVAGFTFLNFFAQMPVFAIGIAVYHVFMRPDLRGRVTLAGNVLFVLGVAVLLGLGLDTLVAVFSNQVAIGLLFGLVALDLAAAPVPLLVNRAIVFVGKLSFSMYLTHFAVLELLSRLGLGAALGRGNAPSLLFYGCVVMLTVLVSYVCYSTIEKRGIALGKSIIGQLERARLEPMSKECSPESVR